MKINKYWGAILLGLGTLIALFLLGGTLHGLLGVGGRSWFENLFVLWSMALLYFIILNDREKDE